MKKILLLLLALAMCIGMLAGCDGSSNNEQPTEDPNATKDTLPPEEDIGDYDFENAEFNILTRSETSYEHVGEAGASDSVSRAVYSRNAAVEELFGVTIGAITMTGGYDSRKEFVTAVRAEHMAPTGAYDLLSTHSVYLGWFAAEGVLSDLSTLPEVDLTKSFWNQNLYNELNIDGSCYIMIGDIGHTLYEYMSVMFVNTEILEDNELVEGNIDGVYDMVEEGTWTWETLYNISANYGKDAEGTYGLLFNTHAMRAAMISQEAGVYSKGTDGKYYLPSAASEHMIKAVENLSKFFDNNSNMMFAKGWGTEEKELNPIFTSGNALFYGQTLGQSATFSTDMGGGYSVLPLPKFDAFQTDYYTICRDTVTAVAVMVSAKDLEMSGVITQALCKYGSEYVTPEYYEKALKYRYSTDPRCPEILEKIRASLTIEAVPTFFETGIDSDMFKEIIENGANTGIAGKYESYVTQGNTLLQNFYLAIEILKG